MFLAKLPGLLPPANYRYPAPLPLAGNITKSQIHRHIDKLSPYKATGTDNIPNVVLKECADIILPFLKQIFHAMFSLCTFYDQWREVITCILWKLGKPQYNVPKAYRPIALLNSIARLAMSIIAGELSHLVETHRLLPATHFGGCPGHSTTDLLHLLVDYVKVAWRRKKVVSALFLDVEGMFPNAVTHCLLHNMRRCRVPKAYVMFVSGMLTGRKTCLKFNDYTSVWFTLDNSIGKGDPLSMLYLFYNADILDVAKGPDEMSLGYVDDIALVISAKTFIQTHRMLSHMMLQPKEGFHWSKLHNSSFETSKSTLVDFSQSRTVNCSPLTLHGMVIPTQRQHKFMGVMVDQELRWKQHMTYAIAKATKWVLTFRHLARPSAGICPCLMHQLLIAVTIPKMAYAANVWYMPIYQLDSKERRSGSVGIT